MTASACRSALSVDGALATAVSSCFLSIGRPQFAPQSAYSCISTAPIYCTPTLASCDPFATPTPVLPNGGFESSELSPWAPSITSTPGNVVAAVSNERPYTGSNSLKPGQTYEMSYRWWSSNNIAYAGTSFQVSFPGRSFYTSVNSDSRAGGTWYRESLTFTAPTSFATVVLSWSANRGPSAVVAYLDDAAIVKIS
ncbi:hypothetical protein QBC36DRAFT_232130 [Triangularia setosa]|uniref:CBM-cenC domain-containing protein n=1 Tax=Triangularia setosa TaxID=2587417 RepID=A0AAN6WCH8_9PEZI|nr:hypothetical protein QBC36DRAFT_232130 [Podospora setosa]